jgi:hypothetical protein
MLETPRKRTFASIHSSSSPNSSTVQREQDNPWFRDPSQKEKEEKDHKIPKSEHISSPRSRDSHRLRSPPSNTGDQSNSRGQVKELPNHHGSTKKNENQQLSNRNLKEPEPHKKPTSERVDDTFEDGE